jgi:hypothetical protein
VTVNTWQDKQLMARIAQDGRCASNATTGKPDSTNCVALGHHGAALLQACNTQVTAEHP